jgi:hypothetical protein
MKLYSSQTYFKSLYGYKLFWEGVGRGAALECVFREDFSKLIILIHPHPGIVLLYPSQLPLRDKTHFIIHNNLLVTNPYVVLGVIY